MTDETVSTDSPDAAADLRRLDWGDLVPKSDVHICTCEHCELVGELEPVEWPTLATFTFESQPYVTDRVLAVRAERAPAPQDWAGPALEASAPSLLSYWAWEISDTPPTGIRFREDILQALRLLDWRLRRPVVPSSATGVYGRRLAGVVDEHGEHIGWVMGRSSGGELYVEPERTQQENHRG